MCTLFPLCFYWHILCLNSCGPFHRKILILVTDWRNHGHIEFQCLQFLLIPNICCLLPLSFCSVVDWTRLGRFLRDRKTWISGLAVSPLPRFYFHSLSMTWLHGKIVGVWTSSYSSVFLLACSHYKVSVAAYLGLWVIPES